ncbi:hypothetical protein CCR75_009392 [Bremia lactucae]|uniref:RNA helicase n=1 Tax=Bremia lactucae TaxID=4779 RepID=A0A976FIZ8_BRELC|nr:hypothetical protein CCR75_009392 [Bremia lactucae]
MDQLQREYLRDARRKAPATDYFEAKDCAEEHTHILTPASGSGDDVDPLDAFMQDIDKQVKQERKAPSKRVADKPPVLNLADEEEDASCYMGGFAQSTKKPRRGQNNDSEDSDEDVYTTAKQFDTTDALDDRSSKVMEVLAPIDHSSIQYEPFRKNFYSIHRATSIRSTNDVATLQTKLRISVDGDNVPAPVQSFTHLNFDRKLLHTLTKLKLDTPTAIQAQTFPIALSGRDFIGIAKTGSGKTLAFTLPMVRHVMDQRELQRGEGPIALVLVPTRELAHQTYMYVKKFLTSYGASCAAIYGGAGKWEQVQTLKKGVEVIVATPGRLIEMIRKKVVKMTRVTFVVLDEADRMFEMGFEPQLRSVMGQIRPDRQTLMFSATFRRPLQTLALEVLSNPIKVTIGQVGQANEDICQFAIVLPTHGAKWPWLVAHMPQFVNDGRLLIFANSKNGCEELATNLRTAWPTAPARCLHGDKTQQERMEALHKFKQGDCRVLVATDVAARGLDVKNIKTVVNYDVAKSIDTHVHRIGRTGRMGQDGVEMGTAYTLVTQNESQFAAQLVANLHKSGQSVSMELLALAKRNNGHFQPSVAMNRIATPSDSASRQESL